MVIDQTTGTMIFMVMLMIAVGLITAFTVYSGRKDHKR